MVSLQDVSIISSMNSESIYVLITNSYKKYFKGIKNLVIKHNQRVG